MSSKQSKCFTLGSPGQFAIHILYVFPPASSAALQWHESLTFPASLSRDFPGAEPAHGTAQRCDTGRPGPYDECTNSLPQAQHLAYTGCKFFIAWALSVFSCIKCLWIAETQHHPSHHANLFLAPSANFPLYFGLKNTALFSSQPMVLLSQNQVWGPAEPVTVNDHISVL